MRIAVCRFCGHSIQEEQTALGVMWFHEVSHDPRGWPPEPPDRRPCFTVATPDPDTMTSD